MEQAVEESYSVLFMRGFSKVLLHLGAKRASSCVNSSIASSMDAQYAFRPPLGSRLMWWIGWVHTPISAICRADLHDALLC